MHFLFQSRSKVPFGIHPGQWRGGALQAGAGRGPLLGVAHRGPTIDLRQGPWHELRDGSPAPHAAGQDGRGGQGDIETHCAGRRDVKRFSFNIYSLVN